MRSFLRSLVLAFGVAAGAVTSVLGTPVAVSAAAALPSLFNTEAAAQAHCPREVVVWLNIPSGVYHEKGMRLAWHRRSRLRVRR